MIVRLIIGLILVISSMFSFANTFTAEDCKVQERKTHIIFSNGMFNDQEAIDDSVSKMILVSESTIKEYGLLEPDEVVDYDFVINSSEPLMEQFKQVVSQRNTIEQGKVEKWLRTYGEAPSWLEDHEKEALATKVIDNLKIDIDTYKTDSDLDWMVDFYMDLLDKGGRIIIFAHSQGNMYANFAVERIITLKPEYADSIRVIGVATPDIRVVNGGAYISAEEDKIINGVRTFYESSLPANFSFGINAKFWGFYHSFVDYYMAKANSLNYIEKALEAAFNDLKYPKGNGTEIRFILDKKGNKNIYLAVSEALYGSISIPSFIGPPIDPNLPFGSPNGTLITGTDKDIYTYPCGVLRGRSITLFAMAVNTGNSEHEVYISKTSPATNITVSKEIIPPSSDFTYREVGGFVIIYENDKNSYLVLE